MMLSRILFVLNIALVIWPVTDSALQLVAIKQHFINTSFTLLLSLELHPIQALKGVSGISLG